ncbi:hypothetical protein CFOL_v3_01815, partial [Cephalotus follicularis]
VISLPMTIGKESCQITIFVSFLVVRMPPTYNVILGHPSKAALKDVVSIPYLNTKFPIPREAGVAQGDHSATFECYFTSLKPTKKVLPIDMVEVEESKYRGRPVEELEEVFLGEELNHKSVKIGTHL